MEFTKDYTKLIAQARENGDNGLVAQLTRQMNDEAFLQDEALQRATGKKIAESMNQKAGMGKKV